MDRNCGYKWFDGIIFNILIPLNRRMGKNVQYSIYSSYGHYIDIYGNCNLGVEKDMPSKMADGIHTIGFFFFLNGALIL